MTITNGQSGTNLYEIADGIYRIDTPLLTECADAFSYLIVDDEPLLFHTGLRKMFSLTREAVHNVLPVERLRYVALAHVETDECGSLNEWLLSAPQSMRLCGTVAGMMSISDLADRAPACLPMASCSVWANNPCAGSTREFAHAWQCGVLTEERTTTLHVVICSRRVPLIFRHSRCQIFSGRARHCASDGLLLTYEECTYDA